MPPASTTPSPRIELPALTGLRGVAALWVLLYHGWQAAGAPHFSLLSIPLWWICSVGYLGVDLFFVLSGFLLGAPFALAAIEGRPMPDMGRFWRRRLGRVLPAYWGQLLILGVILVAAGGDWPLTLTQTLAQLTLTENLLPVFNEPVNPVYWSLPVEWDFYILLPLLVLPLRRISPWKLLIAVFAFSLAYRFACVWAAEVYRADALRFYVTILQLPSRLDEFAMGMAAGLLAGRVSDRRAGMALIAGLLVIAGLVAALHGVGDWVSGVRLPWVYFVYSVAAIGFGLLTLGAARAGQWTALLLANPPLRAMGIISYSLYLWHYPILGWLRDAGWIGSQQGLIGSLGLLALCSVAVATLSWRLLERPFHTPPRPPSDVEHEQAGVAS